MCEYGFQYGKYPAIEVLQAWPDYIWSHYSDDVFVAYSSIIFTTALSLVNPYIRAGNFQGFDENTFAQNSMVISNGIT